MSSLLFLVFLFTGKDRGGAIASESRGRLNIDNCWFSGNHAQFSYVRTRWFCDVEFLSLCNSLTHPYCSPYEQGGAVYSEADFLIVKNTTFMGNVAANLGGGLYMFGDVNVDMEGCKFSGNSARNVGACLLIEIAGSFHSLMH
jgi:predicted outer membrane repeat protein